jgi:hypothetical protein
LHNMLLFPIACLQIGASLARFPTISMNFVSNGDMFQDASIILVIVQLHTCC